MKKYIGSLFLFILFIFNASAKEYIVPSDVTISGTGQILDVIDPRYTDYSSSWSSMFNNQSIVNKIIISQKRTNLDYVPSAVKLQVTLKIEQERLNGLTLNPSTTTYKTVELSYSPKQDSSEIDQVVLSYNDIVHSKVTVQSVTVTGSPNVYGHSDIPILFLENYLYIERIEAMSLAAPDHNHSNMGMNYDVVDQNANNHQQMVTLSWPIIAGAESYEIEFSFDFDPQNRQATPTSFTHTDVDFTHNATRIRVDDANYYKLPVVLPEGNLIFRVRGISKKLNQQFEPIYTLWSMPDRSTVNLPLRDGKNAIRINNYDESANWNFTLSYAEKATYSSVLTYHDGLLRVRQTTAMDHSTGLPMVHSPIFDHLGRETLQAMASPFFDDLGYDFRPKINQDLSDSAYDYRDFDLNHEVYYSPTNIVVKKDLYVGEMSTTSGANYYYSTDFNTYIQGSSFSDEVKRRHSFLPNAEGYAFSQTELSNDPVAKVQRSGMVGKTHQLTSYVNGGNLETGKQTSTWEGVPFQQELDKLFASEAGVHTNYKKVMTRDANGQISVTYMDLYGRTVATALTGNPSNTPNLDPIASSSITTDYNIVLKDSSISSDQKIINQTFTVSEEGPWEFSYSFEPQLISAECDQQFCYQCAYDLTISLLDKWGNEVLPNGPYTAYVGEISDSLSCGDTILFEMENQPLQVTLYPDPGEYTLVKTLTLSQEAKRQNREWYFTQSGCVKPFVDFLADELTGLNFTCQITCEQCEVQLSDLTHIKDSIELWCETNQVDTNAHNDFVIVATELSELKAVCDQLCESNSPCSQLYGNMLSDVSLGGQYMQYTMLDEFGQVEFRIGETGFTTKTILKEDWWDCDPGQSGVERNWRKPDPFEGSLATAHYKDENGDESLIYVVDGYPALVSGASYVQIDDELYAKPHELEDVSDFIKFWRPSWAKSLVYMHPEYCYYQKCQAIEESYAYDQKLITTLSATEAQEKGYYNPLNMNTLGTLDFQYGGPQNIDYSGLEDINQVERDPITQTSYFTGNNGDFMTRLSNYTQKIPDTQNPGQCISSTATIWELYEQYRMDQGITSNVFTQDTCIEDVFWPVLRGLYLAVKQQWLQEYYTDACPDGLSCSDEVPASLISVDRFSGAASIGVMTDVNPAWTGLLDICETDDLKTLVDQGVEDQCNDACDANVELWLGWLSGCSKITSLLPSELTTLKADLKTLCMSGCDMDHPFGSVSRSPSNHYDSQYPFRSLHDVFVKNLGSDWFEAGICDDLLIEFPGYYGHDYLATDDPKASDCACDSVKWHTPTSCPDFIYNVVTDTCACSYPHDLMVAKANLKGLDISEKCQSCITCIELVDPVRSFLERYDSTNFDIDSLTHQSLLATWLNRHFGFNLTYDEYALFAIDCADTTQDTTWIMLWEDIAKERLVSNFDNTPFYQQKDIKPTHRISPKNTGQPDEIYYKIPDLSGLARTGFIRRTPQGEFASLINKPIAGFETAHVQSTDADKIACHCEKILAIGYLEDQNQLGSLTPTQMYDQLYPSPNSWPSGWNFSTMKKVCCKLWNGENTSSPSSCTLNGSYEPGDTFTTGDKDHIDLELLDPARDPAIDYFGDEGCTPNPPVGLDKDYIDTCGCKAIKELDSLFAVDPMGQASGIDLEAYVYQELGYSIDDIDALLSFCEKMWGTGQKKTNGQVNTQWSPSLNWSKISITNLDEFAFDDDITLNKSLLCGPKDTCEDVIICSQITMSFMKFSTAAFSDLGVLSTNYGNVADDLPRAATYSDPTLQAGLLYQWLQDLVPEQPLDPQWQAKKAYLEELKRLMNEKFSACDPNGGYSIDFYLNLVRSCNKIGVPDGDPRPEPCIKEISCKDVGQAFKDFLAANPRPDDPGYAPAALETYASDLGALYTTYFPFNGTVTTQVQDMLDWFELLETYFNEQFNKCYKSSIAESKRNLGEFLLWTHRCGSDVEYAYKADPCPTCYTGDTTYLGAFRLFLDQVTEKPNPDYLHQSLWNLDNTSGNLDFDIDKFHNNPTLYNNGFPGDLEYIAHDVSVPELDITIEDKNGYELSFNLLFPSAEKKWNFGKILEFLEIRPVKSSGCNAPNLFEVVAVYDLPEKYWGSRPGCPNELSNSACFDTIVLSGRFKNIDYGEEIPCLSCARLCNKPLFRPIPKKDRCHDWDVQLAISNALTSYSVYLTEQTQKFDSLYSASCMNKDSLDETVQIEYTDRTYHYTLYHYDRAGNLVKTVPPSGIDFESPDLSEVDRNLLINDRINKSAKYRAGLITSRPITYHGLITRYTYNSLNGLIEQQTPDGGKASQWYDGLGRLVFSQSSTQKAEDLYSYITYDPQGRPNESGQIDPINTVTNFRHNECTDPAYVQSVLDVSSSPSNKTQVTRSYYDEIVNSTRIAAAFSDLSGQQNLRKGVAAVSFEEINDDDGLTYDHASYYTYDAMGNVNRLVQDIPALEALEHNLYSFDYHYDLLSGNTLKVYYQKEKADQFIHKYTYDELNRLTNVYTSQDDFSWQRDAKYEFYLHGALARIELGELNVQGIDYVNTLQGTIKSFNSPVMDPAQDVGQDGLSTSSLIHGMFARDAFAVDLHYYTDDYKPIHNSTYGPLTAGSDLKGNTYDLFNGNIARMVTSIAQKNDYQNNHTLTGEAMGNVYKYDQLNRITAHKAFKNINATQTAWSSGGYNGDGTYYEDFSYDPSGNITDLNRNGHISATPEMDQFEYHYDKRNKSVVVDNGLGGTTTVSWGQLHTNKLYHVDDHQSHDGRYSNDIDDSTISFNSSISTINTVNSYGYDELGNLIRDEGNQIAEIKWTASGKIKSVKRNTGSLLPDLEFGYDAADNRMYKTTKPKDGLGALENESLWFTEYYIYDGAGSLISTYTVSYTDQGGGNYSVSYRLSQMMIYGSSRLGATTYDSLMATRDFSASISPQQEFEMVDYGVNNAVQIISYSTQECSTIHGLKQYELSNHLGNVLATIQDRKQLGDSLSSGLIEYFIPFIETTQDYYAFGSLMEERGFEYGGYKFGFNGQEKDDDVAGKGNSMTAMFWQYDSRLGRRWNVDPIFKEYESPYSTFSNNPILLIDPNGADTTIHKNPDGYDMSGFNASDGEITFRWINFDIDEETDLPFAYESQSYQYHNGNQYFEAGLYTKEDYQWINLDFKGGQVMPAISYWSGMVKGPRIIYIDKVDENGKATGQQDRYDVGLDGYLTGNKNTVWIDPTMFFGGGGKVAGKIAVNGFIGKGKYFSALKAYRASNLALKTLSARGKIKAYEAAMASILRPSLKLPFPTTDHFVVRYFQRASRLSSRENVVNAYNSKTIFYNPVSKNYIRYHNASKVYIVSGSKVGGKAISVMEGAINKTWVPIKY